jgi:hypothetical protein
MMFEFISLNGLLILALAVPLLRFLSQGWQEKREELMDRFDDAAINAYYSSFFPGRQRGVDRRPLKERFQEDYNARFGRTHFIFPLIILFSITLFLSIISTQYLFFNAGLLHKYPEQPWTAVLANAGAYMWVLNDMISRGRRNDIVASDVNRATLRLMIGAPIAYAFASILQPPFGQALAMFLGAFPTETVFKLIRRQAAERLNMGDDLAGRSAGQLELLQGVNTSISERFSDEGVSTILQLAYCDPIYLTMRSGMTFSFVTDCVSQALAWVYLLDERTPVARRHGFRGAQEISDLLEDLEDEDPKVTAGAVKALDNFSQEIELDPDEVRGMFRQIAEDPHSEFLVRVWFIGLPES